MRTNRIFWGLVIILLGSLLLMQTLGILSWSVWTYFWPIFLILLGVWFILGPVLFKSDPETKHLAIPVENFTAAAIEIKHGAGRLTVDGGAGPSNLLDGDFVGGTQLSINRTGERALLKLAPDSNAFPWNVGASFGGFLWNVHLRPGIPLDLVFQTGAGESQLDFSDLIARSVVLETGASSTQVTLPSAAGSTRCEIRSGVASVVVRVPQGVAGRIHLQGGLMGEKIDKNRFPFNGTTYETPGFDTAANRVEIKVETGVGSIEIISL